MKALILLAAVAGCYSTAPITGVSAAHNTTPTTCPPEIVAIPAGWVIRGGQWVVDPSVPARTDTLAGVCLVVTGK